MKLTLAIDEADIVTAVKSYVTQHTGILFDGDIVLTIEVKSKQNYKSEWEKAAFRGVVSYTPEPK